MQTSSIFKFIQRAKHAERLNVVFFGGSLTWGANASDPNITSWRGLTMKMLCEKYPDAHFSFKDSAVGGTGSSLGVFRMERDVFTWNPDLVLLDFTLNDGLEGGKEGLYDPRNQSYEAIIRECIKRKTAVLPVFLTAKKHVETEDLSQFKRRLEHIELFRKYNLEYADVLGLMNEAYHSGKIDVDALWPVDTVHPLDDGYAAYAEFFKLEWERIENSVENVPVMPDDFVCGKEFSNIKRIDLHKLALKKWTVDYPCVVSDCFDWLASRWLDRIVERSAEDSILEPFTLKVKAGKVAVMIETVADSVPFSVSIDGSALQEIKVRSVLRSQLHYVSLADELDPDRVHTLTVVPDNSSCGEKSVMRWGAVLLNSDGDIEFEIN